MEVKICDFYWPQKSDSIITTIPRVEETEINDCAQKILAENSKVAIYNIYYSRMIKSLDFKAAKQLSITNWLRHRAETEINSLLNQEEIQNDHFLRLYDDNFKYTRIINEKEDFINLYDLNQIVLKTHKEYNNLLESFNKKLAEQYHNVKINYFNVVCFIATIDKKYKYKLSVNFGNKNLYISKNPDNSLVKIYNQKEDFSLVELNREDRKSLNINNELIADLSYMYDSLMKYGNFFYDDKFDMYLINSKFAASICPWAISIKLLPTGSLQLNFSRFNKYELKGELAETMQDKITNKEDLIFKNAFIRIGNCPAYFQKVICNIVNEKLEHQKRKQKTYQLKL